MMKFNLYTTSHCHLCEQAEELLSKLSKQYAIHWHSIEITDSPELLETYSHTIPVIKNLKSNTEIAWPFCEKELQSFILQQNNL